MSGSRLHRWGTNGDCEFCGANVHKVSVNGGLFCAGTPEARLGSSDGEPMPQTQTPGPAAGGGYGGTLGGGPSPGTGQQGPSHGSASPIGAAPAHDWDAAGFCKLCRLGMYAVKQLGLPCRPVPQAYVAGYSSAHQGHLFSPQSGICMHCSFHQLSVTFYDRDCVSAKAYGVPPIPGNYHGPQQVYAGPQIAPYTPDPQPKSPYLVQWSEVYDFNAWSIDTAYTDADIDRASESRAARYEESLRLLGFKSDD